MGAGGDVAARDCMMCMCVAWKASSLAAKLMIGELDVGYHLDMLNQNSEAPEMLKNVMLPGVWGTAANHHKIRLELGALPCIRLQMEGTRKVALLPMGQVQQSISGMADRPGGHSGRVSSTEVCQFLESASDEWLQNYVTSGNNIVWATLGPGESHYIELVVVKLRTPPHSVLT